MYEKNKLAEAKYFYSQMIKNRGKRDVYSHNLSAFLSASRSVLQYASEEVRTKPNGQRWFDDYVFKTPIFKFFKEKRDINIHDKPIEPNKNADINFNETIHVSEQVSAILRNKNGKIKQQINSGKTEQSQDIAYTPSVVKLRYIFVDWPGNEDVETLSKLYLDELEIFINDGLNKGLIIG
jgi:hypothetical protein